MGAAGLSYGPIRQRYSKPRKYPCRDDVIAAIRRRKKSGLPLNSAAVNGRGPQADRCLLASAIRDFGSWPKAISAAGLDIKRIRRTEPSPYGSREEVVQAIVSRQQSGLSLNLVGVTEGEHADVQLKNAACRSFGNWRSAVTAAGIDYEAILARVRKRKYPTSYSVLQEIRRRHESGLSLKTEAISHGREADSTLYIWAGRHFGSWRLALIQSGIDCSATMRRRKYDSPEEVLKAIWEREESGQGLSPNAVAAGAKRDYPLLYSARLEFRTWSEAIRAAARRKRMVAQIREMHLRGEPLNITAVKRRHPDLMGQVYDEKPFWGWKQALETADIRYSEIRVHLEDTVACRICGKRMQILGSHLRQRHRMTSNEYLRKFPGAEMIAETFRAQKSPRDSDQRMLCTMFPHWEPITTPEYILDRIAEAHRLGIPLNARAVQFAEASILPPAIRHFGSWDAALLAAGLEPEAIRLRPPSRCKACQADAVPEGK